MSDFPAMRIQVDPAIYWLAAVITGKIFFWLKINKYIHTSKISFD